MFCINFYYDYFTVIPIQIKIMILSNCFGHGLYNTKIFIKVFNSFIHFNCLFVNDKTIEYFNFIPNICVNVFQ